MPHIDIELKRDGKALFQQTRRDKNALGIAGINVAMAKRPLGWLAFKAFGHHSFIAFANGERDKVKRFAVQGRGYGKRHGMHNPLQIIGRKHDLAGSCIADTIRCLSDSRVANNLLRGAELRIDCLTHVIILTYR